MTNEEKQEIVNEVLAALHTHGKTIDQLTPVTSPSDSDTFELSGGRNLSYGKLKELITAIFTAALNSYVPADALWEYIQQYVAKLGDNGALDWQESPVVMLATMGTTYDNVDGELPAYTLQEGDMYYQYGVNYQIFRKLAQGAEGLPAKERVVYINMRTMRLYKWTGSTMVCIAKVSSVADIVNNLVEGGGDKALSAEMGKELNERLEELEEGGTGGGTSVTIDYNNSTHITTFTWGGPALPRSARPTISYATGAENVVVTITAAAGATITAYVDDVLTPLDANGQITFARGAAGTATVTKTIRATALESGKAQSLAREVTVNIPAVDAVQTDSPTITAALDDNNNPTRLVVTATGDGTINLSVNGETATGSGTASITIYCGDTALTGLTATATAQDTGEEMSDPTTLGNISIPAATVPSATPTVSTTETDNDVTIAATGTGTVKLFVDGVEQSGASLTVNKGATVQTLSVYATAKEQGKTLATSATQSVTVGAKSTLLAGTCASNSPFNVTVGNSTYPASIEQEANQDGSYNWSVDIPTSALPTVSAEAVTLVALNNATGTNIFGGTSESPDTNILTITAIPAAVQAIADSCFKYCSELTEIDIHVNERLFLGSACLYNTPKLRRLSIDSTRLYCGTTNIQPCNSTTGDTTNGLEVVLSSRVAGSMALVSGGGAMFNGCTALRSINLEDTSVTGLATNGTSDSFMFYGCTGLAGISLPGTLTVLGKNPFIGCSSLASIDIGDDESIATQTISASQDSRPFEGCGASNLAVHIHSSVAAITNIRLPNLMKTITIEEGIKELYSFSGCSAFASVTLPESLKTIVAFYGCSSLTSIVVNRYLPNDAAPITALTYSTPFTNVPAACAISVPYGAGSAYKNAAGWSGRASYITERAETN